MLSVLAAAILAAAPDAAPSSPPGNPPGERVRCKRELETGSLVSRRKICHTEREWDEIARQAQTEWGRRQGTGFKAGQ